METHHKPVMVRETLDALQVKAGGRYVDCTVGEGGHTLAILESATPRPRVLGIDLDPQALETARRRLEAYARHVVLVQGSYADLAEVAARHGFAPADGVLMDLGLSSLQLEVAARGFSFQQDAPLDMRFDPSQRITAHEVVNRWSEQELADIVFQYGEEPAARRIARAIVRGRPIRSTTHLADVVASALGGRRGRIHPATRTFQAIRMAVNRELDNLRRGLEQAVEVLAPGGRLVVISYHSLEDRLVKNALRMEASGCICPRGTPQCVCGHSPRLRLVSRKVLTPSQEEVRSNPRSRSARMRVAEKV